MQELQNILQDAECVAVGEIGLDYTKDFSPRDIQKYVFEKQVRVQVPKLELEFFKFHFHCIPRPYHRYHWLVS